MHNPIRTQMKKRKILVADDDPAILDALQLILEMNDYQVVTSCEGQTITIAHQELPDLLLLDIWMSGEDGREVAKALKSHAHTHTIPIILVSASQDIERSARESGAEDFIPKPFEMGELLNKVEKYLQ